MEQIVYLLRVIGVTISLGIFIISTVICINHNEKIKKLNTMIEILKKSKE